MRKQLLAAASMLVMITGAAWANDSTVNQDGSDNAAAVDQTGGVEGVATINQTGDGHTAAITQTEIPTLGSAGFTTPANIATVTQIGPQFGADAVVTQNSDNPGGASNEVNIYQNTADTTGLSPAKAASAEARQDGSGNFADISQGRDGCTLYCTRSQFALVEQVGQDNESFSSQSGSEGDLNVYQNGNNNYSNIDQPGFANTAGDLNNVGVTQLGSFNSSDVSQSAQLGQVTVLQDGVNNGSAVSQFNSGGASRMMVANVTQTGDDNNSEINQTSGLLVSGNTATVDQSSNGNDSLISQFGTDNSATITQWASSGNVSTVMQTGSMNVATVSQ